MISPFNIALSPHPWISVSSSTLCSQTAGKTTSVCWSWIPQSLGHPPSRPRPSQRQHSSSSPVDDLNQALFQCEKSISASDDRIQCIRFITPNRTAKDLLHLELSEISCITTNAVVNIIAIGLYYIWKSRCEKKSAQSYKMRADIEASILIESKFT